MQLFMGIDLGTSSVKACIANTQGEVLASGSCGYSFDVLQMGYAQQDLCIWWESTKTAIAMAVKYLSKEQINHIMCIGLSGQMHGLVCLNKDKKQIRPAILHCDQRTNCEIEDIYSIIAKEELGKITFNQLSTGFLLPSLMWIKKHEPHNYRAIYKIMLPKDYIRFELTGEIATEYSDASGTLAFDINKNNWSFDIINKLGLDCEIFPHCFSSMDIAGTLQSGVANELGLKAGIPVIFGGADQPMQALGSGAIEPGMTTSNIGTSGQIFQVQSQPILNPLLNTNLFCNVLDNSWYSMGAIMSAGIALKWLTGKIINKADFKELDCQVSNISPGSEGLIFLPYLMGERTPHMNSNAKGMFFGLCIKHDYSHMTRSVMEGVCFALKDCLLTQQQHGSPITGQIIASGGGTNSPIWKQMQADIYNREIKTTKATENACIGAIILAALGIGIYENAKEACANMIHYDKQIVTPNPNNVQIYADAYEKFKKLYSNNHDLF